MAATHSNSNLIIIARRLAGLRKPVPCPFFRVREGHWATYEKNPEEEICPTVVPDHMIHPLSDNYWAPHPQTGVFGPPTQHNNPLPIDTSARGGGGGGRKQASVLDLKVWFRHNGLEDPEKPHVL